MNQFVYQSIQNEKTKKKIRTKKREGRCIIIILRTINHSWEGHFGWVFYFFVCLYCLSWKKNCSCGFDSHARNALKSYVSCFSQRLVSRVSCFLLRLIHQSERLPWDFSLFMMRVDFVRRSCYILLSHVTHSRREWVFPDFILSCNASSLSDQRVSDFAGLLLTPAWLDSMTIISLPIES